MSELLLEIGTVTSTSPFTVTVGASTSAVHLPRNSAYANPAIGDVVWVLTQGAVRLVGGKCTP